MIPGNIGNYLIKTVEELAKNESQLEEELRKFYFEETGRLYRPTPNNMLHTPANEVLGEMISPTNGYIVPEARKKVHEITSRIFNELVQRYNQNGETNFEALGSMHFVYYMGAGAMYLTGINLDSLIEATRRGMNPRRVKVQWENGTELKLPELWLEFLYSIQNIGTQKQRSQVDELWKEIWKNLPPSEECFASRRFSFLRMAEIDERRFPEMYETIKGEEIKHYDSVFSLLDCEIHSLGLDKKFGIELKTKFEESEEKFNSCPLF